MLKRLLILFLVFFAVLQLKAQTFDWGRNAGSTGADQTRAIATDAQNNVYQLVFFSGSLTLDSAGTPKTIANYGIRDIAVIKYNCNKIFQWAIRIGGAASDGGIYNNAGLAVDTNGNIYIHTTFSGTTNITSANGSNQVRNGQGSTDAVLIKANNNGIVQWVNLIGGTGADESGSVAVDRNQEVYVCGMYYNTAIFTQTAGPSQNQLSFGSSDFYVAKYTSAGGLVYVSRGGGNLQDLASGIAVDSSLNAYICGNFGCCGNSFVNFGANNLNNTGGWGGYAAKLDGTGALVWGVGMGTGNNEQISKIVVDDVYDRVYFIGHFQGNSQLSSRPPGANINLTGTNANINAFIACSNMNGSLQFARTFGGTANEYGYDILLDPNRNLVVTGEFNSATDFGGGSISPTVNGNAYLARYTRTNVFTSAVKLGNGNQAGGYALAQSSSGQIYVGGYYQGQLTTTADVLNSVGSDDAFLVRTDLANITTLAATKTSMLCANDTTVLSVSNKTLGDFYWMRNDTIITNAHGNLYATSNPGTYKVISMNACAPADTSAGIVIVKSPYYVAPAVSDITICRGDSARFNLSAATTYHWSPATGLSDTAIANPFVKVNSATTYYITRTLNGCISLDTAIVNVSANCCLTCSTPYQINQGIVACYPFTGNAKDESGNGNDATVFNAFLTQDRFNVNNRAYNFDGFSSYLEVPNSSSLQSPTANITFTFWARVSNWNFSGGIQFNPVVSKSVAAGSAQYRTLIRSNGVYAMANGNSYNGVIGSATNLNTWYFFAVTVSNDTVYYYRNGLLLGTVVGPVAYTINNTTPLRIGRNDVNSTSFFSGRLDEVRIYGRTLTAAEVLMMYNLSNINGLPTVTAGADKNICFGDSVQLTTTGSNGTWLWTPSTLLSSDTARSPVSKTDSTRTYIVRVDVSGCRNYDTVNVNVVRFQPDLGVDRAICKGDTATLIVLNGGNTFTWTPNYRITSLTNDTTKVFPQVDTSYIVSSNNGICVRRDTIHIAVTAPVVNAGPDQNVCQGDTAYFSPTSNGTLRWSPFKWLNDSVGFNVYSVPDSSIKYVATANYLGCLAYDTIELSVATLPIDAGPNQQICYGDSVQLAASGGVNYIWLPSYRISDTSIANPWVKPLVPTYYYVVSFNSLCSRYDSVLVDVKRAFANAGPDYTLCNGDSVQLNATVLGTSHVWSPSAGLSDTTLRPWAKPVSTTNYVLSATTGLCNYTDTVKITIVNFNISAGANKSICKGDSVQLQAIGAPKFNWLPVYNISDTGVSNPWVHPLGPTNYIAMATNGYCLRKDTVFVDVKSMNATAGRDTSMCQGQFVGLNASGGVTYEWLTTYNISELYIPNPLVTPNMDTSYVVKIKDAGSCTTYDTVFVDFTRYPIVNAGIDYKLCPGESTSLLGSVSEYTKLEWSPAAGLNDKFLMQPVASPAGTTEYWLNAWNGNCFSADNAVVTINPKVSAAFKADPTTGQAPLPVTFTNSSQNAFFYLWDFGDLSLGSNEKDPLHTYTDEGTYTITLIASDSLGCADTTRTKVSVIVNEYIYMPDAFTPNGDGLNDVFQPSYNPNRFEFVEMSIFNRWGVKVFETKVPGGTFWDGKTNGTLEGPGVFTYYVVAKDKKGKSYEFNGTVNVVR